MKTKKRIMIVDDIEFNRVALRRLFEDNYDILECGNGKGVLDLLEKGVIPDVILLDIIMPEMDGMEVLKYLQEHSEYSKIPVIMETGQEDADYEVKALELGAVDFIRKPYHPEAVKYRVHNVLERAAHNKDKLQYDRLTHIYSKTAFYDAVQQLIQRRCTEEPYVLVLADIERFKVVNDLFGTDTGDKILKEIARCLSEHVKGKGVCGRLQGDNFAFCMQKKLLDIQQLIQESDRVIRKYELRYQLVINYGIYQIDNADIPVHIMCDRARLALQTVKGNYLKRFAVYDSSLRKIILEEQQIVNEMNEALAKGQFSIYLQPVFNMKTGKAVTAEALVRWIHPERGVIPPDKFIPLFERNGFISKLDYFVWEEACKVLHYMKKHKKRVIPISVNLSRVDFYNQELCGDILKLIHKYELDTSMFKMEITETAYTENPEQLVRTLEVMRQNGLEIYMDDFGSGYSSLNMLKDVPVDVLKVDMKFLEGIETSDKAGSILLSIYKMAKALNMPVIAEGVETKGQLDVLGQIGGERVQGYYYSEPLPVDKYLQAVE